MTPETTAHDPTSATTFPQLIRAAAAAYGDAPAVVLKNDGLPDESLTFIELERRSAELARGLIARGVGKGARIGFICGNGPAFAVQLAAIARIGAVAIPISTMIRANELVRVLRQSDVSGLIVQRTLLGNDYVERICDALPDLREAAGPDLRLLQTPFLRWIASSGENLPASFQDISQLTERADTVSEALLTEIEAEVHPADQMVEIYTSGSMALPKGVRHNHGPVMFRTHWIRPRLKVERGMQVTAALPMFWVGGLVMYLLPNWEVGATTICTERTMSNSRVAMGSVLAAEDLELMKQAPINWALGMTETIGPYSWGDEVRVPGYPLCAPLDHVADRYEVRVWDEDAQQEAGEGGIGEIQVRGYALTPGLHKIERGAPYFEPDGFYRTGDMGLVAGGRILFVGRNGDMIKTAGSNVSPAEVEMELQLLDGVHSAYVVGLPDTQRGQLLVAAVVPRDGAELDFADLEAKLRQRLSSYKVPRAYVAITRDEVPMLHSNKVSRRQVERMMAERLGRE
ncbi:class I adenylate-forming enzyme family protein [Phenylobacterium sp. LjRoot219]|uniref:class I adenylate-forming enzyme family protein n=1 Tax=Phenylobacterium sp. LjRoot219 TaxID=3342283 RepID=UPI003ED087C8